MLKSVNPTGFRIDPLKPTGFGIDPILVTAGFTKTKKPFTIVKGFLKKGDDILSHKMQYHLRRRA